MGAIVFAVDGPEIRLRTGMINLGVDPHPSPGALLFGTQTHRRNAELPLVHATDDSTWANVAIALAGDCRGAKLVDPSRELARLGPAWRDADCLAVFHGLKPLSVVPPKRGPSNVNSGLIGVRPKLEACYAAGLVEDPTIAGRVVVSFAIDEHGSVSDSVIKRSSLRAPLVEGCMAQAVASGSFSSADRSVVVRYAFEFSTPERP